MRRLLALSLLACGCGDDAVNHLPDAPVADAAPDATLTPSTLDTTFGDHGRVVRTSGACQRMVVDGEGRAILLLFDGLGYRLARYTAEGAVDSSFGSSGEVAVAESTQLAFGFVFAMPSGKIVVTGTDGDNNGHDVYRFDSDGTPDAGFGTAGHAVTMAGQPFGTFGAGERSDGGLDLVALGSGASYVLARLTPAGALDPTFGTNGIAMPASDVPAQYFPHFAYLADGRFVLSAGTFPQGGTAPSTGHLLLVQDDTVVTTTTADNTQYLWMVRSGDHAYTLADTFPQPGGLISRVDRDLAIDPAFAPSIPLLFDPEFGLYNGGEVAVAASGELMATNSQVYGPGGNILRSGADGTLRHADDVDALFGATNVGVCGLAFDASGHAIVAGNAGTTDGQSSGTAIIVRATSE